MEEQVACPRLDNEDGEYLQRARQQAPVDAELAHVNIPDSETARLVRFLGSPTIRVDGRDIEPGADERTDYAFACRIYRTARGTAGAPDERWLRDALVA